MLNHPSKETLPGRSIFSGLEPIPANKTEHLPFKPLGCPLLTLSLPFEARARAPQQKTPLDRRKIHRIPPGTPTFLLTTSDRQPEVTNRQTSSSGSWKTLCIYIYIYIRYMLPPFRYSGFRPELNFWPEWGEGTLN